MSPEEFETIRQREKAGDGTCTNEIEMTAVHVGLMERWGFIRKAGITGKTRIVIEYDADTGKGWKRITAENRTTNAIRECRLAYRLHRRKNPSCHTSNMKKISQEGTL